MPDFAQYGPITSIHDLGTVHPDELEVILNQAVERSPIGLVLPVTASDMRAEPFAQIIEKLARTQFVKSMVIVLNRADAVDDYLETYSYTKQLGDRARILWTDGPRGKGLFDELTAAGFDVSRAGKGRAVWMAFGYLLADASLKAFALQDCDIVNYDNDMLVRLCLPMTHPSLDFDFCKAYYARCTDRMHGRVARLLMTPLTRAMISVLGSDRYLVFVRSFRYPLAGEFAISAALARSNRIPCDWGLEVGTLAEVFRNTSPKRVCQVDLGRTYEHKHQPVSLEDRRRGLMGMATDILTSILRTLMSHGMVVTRGHLQSIRNSYLRLAQDSIRQYHADALMNSLEYDRHGEEDVIEAFAEQISAAGEIVLSDPLGASELPTWARVVAALPDFFTQLRQVAEDDLKEYV